MGPRARPRGGGGVALWVVRPCDSGPDDSRARSIRVPENPASIWRLPRGPAVYALYGGGPRERDLAYIGAADILVRRAVEQLVVRDPLVLAESAGIALLPFYVSEIRWWSDPSFADGHVLRAAELVACETLDPPLRGRSRASAHVFALCEDPLFRERMAALFRSEPLGCLALPTQAHALEWLAALELRIKTLERVTDVRGTGTGGNSSDLSR
jgi:hypothetical protein